MTHTDRRDVENIRPHVQRPYTICNRIMKFESLEGQHWANFILELRPRK
jgi:hypothetical protein